MTNTIKWITEKQWLYESCILNANKVWVAVEDFIKRVEWLLVRQEWVESLNNKTKVNMAIDAVRLTYERININNTRR